MTRRILAICILSLTFTTVGLAQRAVSSAQPDAQYTQAQLKELAFNAHAPEQYKALSSYYGKQQGRYLALAAEEKAEFDRRSEQPIVSILAKYPRPVDSSRNLYEYYMYKAKENGELQAKYDRMATPNAIVNAD